MASAQRGRALYLVVEMRVRDWDELRDYGGRVVGIVERFGGQILAISGPSLKTVEGSWAPDLLAVHRWPSLEAFESFYTSEEYSPLKTLRQQACASRMVVF